MNAAAMLQPEVIDADECAALLRCSVEQVEESTRAGELPGIKQGRGWIFVRSDLLDFIAQRARQEAAERKARREANDKPSNVTAIAPQTKPPRRNRPPVLPTPA